MTLKLSQGKRVMLTDFVFWFSMKIKHHIEASKEKKHVVLTDFLFWFSVKN
jgi:hypothetical protein